MRIVVFGASGRTGREVVLQAHAAGSEVTAVAREGSVVPEVAARVVRTGFSERAAIEDAVAGADVVVSALGGAGRGPTAVCADGARAAVAAMRATGVRRLLVVSAAGLPGEGDDIATRWLVKPILQRVFRHPYADMAAMEQIVRDSGLDWTIVRPPQLTDGPRTDRCRRAFDRHVHRGFRVARADVAAELLRDVVDPDTVGHLVAIAD